MKPPAPRVAKAGELLFEFHIERTHKSYRCELRDHGEYGVEAQFLDPVDVVFSRKFSPHPDLTRTPRAMAIAWGRGRAEGDRRKRCRCWRTTFALLDREGGAP